MAASRLRRAPTREIRLTALAIWRGVTGIYHSNDLTFASSIAYYSLLSLFPFFLLVLSILASVTDNDIDRAVGPRLRPSVLSRASSSS